MTKQVYLLKVKINQKFWYVENHMRVIEGIHLGLGLAIINGKYENMNPKLMVHKYDPRKVTK